MKQLEAFYWAASCKSFSLAAGRLHLSTSSLSKRIGELEQSLGRELFDRSGHKATLTAAGEMLFSRAAALLQEAEETRRAVGESHGLSGVCRIGAGELTALSWLPTFIRDAQRKHPNLQIESVVEGGSSRGAFQRSVTDGSLDCAVVAGESWHSGLQAHHLGDAQFEWVIRRDMVRAGNSFGNQLTQELLDSLGLISLPFGTATSQLVENFLNAKGLVVKRRLSCNSSAVVANFLVSGLGIGILPRSWAQSMIERGKLRSLSSDSRLGTLPYYFLCRRSDRRPIVDFLLLTVRESFDPTLSSDWVAA
ncbi:LysR family transcriptional regulator [Burkholderia sp. WAC0059]|uniref:LysR family transcriptional regulator n=1 Tax=Burkholderia sp. WAC0059 TaxID=2066022 RepID=UPI0015E09BB6|nr:LysR family transcriptional regulator [Burkholderia sp. WAC0059]